ncbi:membrane protein [Clostridia bacterium]|nr:membrane protein [Clostridia bacterium]
MWADTVFPSLFPFIIGINILTGTGFAAFAAALSEGFTRPLFNVPGAGGFALMSGFTSGYPLGAKITGDLRGSGQITKEEGERLLSFTNNSGPLFVLGAVGVKMYQNVHIGYFILFIHYLSAIINGLLFANYKKKKFKKVFFDYKNVLRKAYREMVKYRNAKSFGKIFADSVKNAVETILQIGGFIVLFCVAVRILNLTGVFYSLKTLLLPVCPLDENTIDGILAGLAEVTNGVKTLSANATKESILAAAALISFGGFSIHAQSINFLYKTDISLRFYLLSKLTHAIITVFLGAAFFPFFNFDKETAVTVFNYNLGGKLLFSTCMWGFGAAAFVLSLLFAVFRRKNKL